MNKTDRQYNAISFVYQQIAINADDLSPQDLQILSDLCLAYKRQKEIEFPPFIPKISNVTFLDR